MERYERFFNLVLRLFLAPGLFIMGSPAARSQGNWSRIDLEGGGVVEDLQTLQAGSDVVWAAAMGSGLFRAEWSVCVVKVFRTVLPFC